MAHAFLAVENRLHEAVDELGDAWDDLANAIGIALEGREGRRDIDTCRARVREADAAARAQVETALARLSEGGA
jgi:hypothetical protein